MEKPEGASWVRELERKRAAGELPTTESPDEAPEPDTTWPPTWPDGFAQGCRGLGLRRYLRELADLYTGKLPRNEFFAAALDAWGARGNTRDGIILLGGEGSGKSVTALALCLVEFRQGRNFEFLDAGEFADLWATQDRERIYRLRNAGILVIDEIGDCEDIRGPAFGLLKRIINARYRNDQPVVLTATVAGKETADGVDLPDLRKAIGSEIVDRFPAALRIGTDEGSYRK
jgi:hypothetical protein